MARKFTTEEVARHIMEGGKFYTASMVSHELGITHKEASGSIWNICSTEKKYRIEHKDKPHRIRVLEINNKGLLRNIELNLWHQLLRSEWS